MDRSVSRLPNWFWAVLILLCEILNPLATTCIMAILYAILDLALGGTPDISLKAFVGFALPYSIPLVFLSGPMMIFYYVRLTREGPLTRAAAAKAGLKAGTLPYLVVASLMLLTSMILRSDPLIAAAIAGLVYALFGLMLGPLLAVCFGAILRRLDPRYS